MNTTKYVCIWATRRNGQNFRFAPRDSCACLLRACFREARHAHRSTMLKRKNPWEEMMMADLPQMAVQVKEEGEEGGAQAVAVW